MAIGRTKVVEMVGVQGIQLTAEKEGAGGWEGQGLVKTPGGGSGGGCHCMMVTPAIPLSATKVRQWMCGNESNKHRNAWIVSSLN